MHEQGRVPPRYSPRLMQARYAFSSRSNVVAAGDSGTGVTAAPPPRVMLEALEVVASVAMPALARLVIEDAC